MARTLFRLFAAAALLLSLTIWATPAVAQDASSPDLQTVADTADAALLAGNTAWMLTSSALVLFMTAPGLAMFRQATVEGSGAESKTFRDVAHPRGPTAQHPCDRVLCLTDDGRRRDDIGEFRLEMSFQVA